MFTPGTSFGEDQSSSRNNPKLQLGCFARCQFGTTQSHPPVLEGVHANLRCDAVQHSVEAEVLRPLNRCLLPGNHIPTGTGSRKSEDSWIYLDWFTAPSRPQLLFDQLIRVLCHILDDLNVDSWCDIVVETLVRLKHNTVGFLPLSHHRERDANRPLDFIIGFKKESMLRSESVLTGGIFDTYSANELRWTKRRSRAIHSKASENLGGTVGKSVLRKSHVKQWLLH